MEKKWDGLKAIEAFNQQSNALLDKQRITNVDSLMYPVYEHARKALENVILSSKRWVDKNESDRSNSDKKDFYGYGNNVIAFCAPRGQGKTSAMLSLSHALMHCDQLDKHQDKVIAEQWKKTLAGKSFHIMPPIDPTVLDGKESVVNLVLAWLFQEINDAWKDCKDSPERIEKDKLELLQHFQKCKECLARHNGTKDADFSDLIKKSIIFEIKEHLYAIINCYFRIHSCSDKENYLVIQLDDTDMDMVNAYGVLEDVRKFLSLPRTIVLMATYLRQLRMLVAKHYEDVLSLPNGSKGDSQQPIDYMQMAAKYIDKLIPAQQMIHIGSFRNQHDLNGKVSIQSFLEHYSDEAETKKGNFHDDLPGKESDNNDDLEEEFFALIEAKTGLVFKKHSTYVNNILPTTLRGLVHLFQLLERMELPDPENEFGAPKGITFNKRYHILKIRQRNLLIFEDYFRNDWCYNNLVETDQEIMWKISQTHVAPKLRIIRNLLLARWKWTEDWWKRKSRTSFEPMPNKGDVTLTFNASTKEYEEKSLHYEFVNNTTESVETSITLVDMICLLEEAEHRAESMNDLLLNFAIRTHLSILLNKLYLADELNSSREERSGEEQKAEEDNGVLRGRNHPQLKSFWGYEVHSDTCLSIDAIRIMLWLLLSKENGFSFLREEKNREKRIEDLLDFFRKESSVLLDEKTVETLKQSLEDYAVDFDKKSTLIEECNNFLSRIRNKSHIIISYRVAVLCELFFFDWNSFADTTEKEKNLAVWKNEYQQQCFTLQARVFRLLGNHEVLRLWLSNDAERFAKSKKYVWADPGDSVKTALDNVVKTINSEGSESSTDVTVQSESQQAGAALLRSQSGQD